MENITPVPMSVLLRLLRGSGQVFRNHYLSSKSLLVLLYSPIVSAVGNVVDFMVGTSELVGIALGYAALQSKELQTLVNAVDIGRHRKAPTFKWCAPTFLPKITYIHLQNGRFKPIFCNFVAKFNELWHIQDVLDNQMTIGVKS